jgi:hypothetical protein
MWIVKTLGRRTCNRQTGKGVDRVYSVNGAFITQDLETAVDEAIEVLRDEMGGRAVVSIPVAVYKAPVRPQLTEEYWNGTWKLEVTA